MGSVGRAAGGDVRISAKYDFDRKCAILKCATGSIVQCGLIHCLECVDHNKTAIGQLITLEHQAFGSEQD